MPEALNMLFAAHRDQDPLRVDYAMRHLAFLLDMRALSRTQAPCIPEADAIAALSPEWPDVAGMQR